MGLLEINVLGENCADCAIALKGRENTPGASLCQMIYDAFRSGEVAMELKNDTIVFVVGIVSFGFVIPEKRVCAVRSLINCGNMCLEPIDSEANYIGFELSRNF